MVVGNMSMNRFMHSRNIYKSPPNFQDLAQHYPEFEKYISRKPNGKIIFDFKNPEALRCLTLILLKKDFGLELIIPENKLIPTLPSRLNYILWIEDLLDWTANRQLPVSGVDIGTGATCIYPLLASKKNGWKMLGTEINSSSVETAIENIKKNSLDHLITVKEVSKSSFLVGVIDENETYDFCMCNPPFFNSDAEVHHRNSESETESVEDNKIPSVGATDEILSDGGEIAFVKNIIRDSLKLQNQIKIYTSMIGHKSSLEPLLEELKKNDIKSISQTEFCQGRTVRWAIAWTLTEDKLQNYSSLYRSKLPKPITWLFEPKHFFSECADHDIPQLLSQLKIETVLLEHFKKRKLWRITATEDTWTGARKKRRERLKNEKIVTAESNNESENSCTNDQDDDETAEKSSVAETDSIEEALKIISAAKSKIKESCPKNDYCRQYVLNEKRKLPADDLQIPSKKVKTDENETAPQNYILKALLSAKSIQNKIELQILYESGRKEAPQQIMQFLKNNLSS